MIGPQKSWICMSFENSTTKKIIQNGTLNIHNTKAKSNRGNQKIHDIEKKILLRARQKIFNFSRSTAPVYFILLK